MGGCFTCHREPTVVNKVDEPPERLKTEGEIVRQPSVSEDFWTNTTIDMDNSAAQSQGSVSSISTINQTSDSHTGSSNSPAEFVNHGLLLWNQTRQNWVANKKPDNPAPQVWEPKLNWNATYDSLLGSNKPFPRPIPLSEMVDFLVEVWEQEGMYD